MASAEQSGKSSRPRGQQSQANDHAHQAVGAAQGSSINETGVKGNEKPVSFYNGEASKLGPGRNIGTDNTPHGKYTDDGNSIRPLALPGLIRAISAEEQRGTSKKRRTEFDQESQPKKQKGQDSRSKEAATGPSGDIVNQTFAKLVDFESQIACLSTHAQREFAKQNYDQSAHMAKLQDIGLALDKTYAKIQGVESQIASLSAPAASELADQKTRPFPGTEEGLKLIRVGQFLRLPELGTAVLEAVTNVGEDELADKGAGDICNMLEHETNEREKLERLKADVTVDIDDAIEKLQAHRTWMVEQLDAGIAAHKTNALRMRNTPIMKRFIKCVGKPN